jgi:hypothetical protein
VVRVQDGTQELNMVCDHVGPFPISRRNTGDQCRKKAEFPSKHRMNSQHATGVGAKFFWNFYCHGHASLRGNRR